MVAQTDNWNLNPWDFVAHPEVWLLVGFLTAAYIYTVRVIGPALSVVYEIGIIPDRLHNPTVGFNK